MTYGLVFLGVVQAAENLLLLLLLLILFGIGFWAVSMLVCMGILSVRSGVSNLIRRIRLRYQQPQK